MVFTWVSLQTFPKGSGPIPRNLLSSREVKSQNLTCIEEMLFDGVCWVVVVVGETVFAPEIEIEKIVKTDMVVRRSAFPFSLVIMAVNHQAHCTTVTVLHFKRARCDGPVREH